MKLVNDESAHVHVTSQETTLAGNLKTAGKQMSKERSLTLCKATAIRFHIKLILHF